MAEIDTANRFMVGARGQEVTSLLLGRVFTPEEAMNLAAYLVLMAETVTLLKAGTLPTFEDVKTAIERAS